jgi:hypothetical protein
MVSDLNGLWYVWHGVECATTNSKENLNKFYYTLLKLLKCNLNIVNWSTRIDGMILGDDQDETW